MKVLVDNEEVLTLSETQKKVIKHDINEDIFNEDMKRRLKYILSHKYEQCLERLKKEWIPRLKSSGASSIPLDDEALAEMIFSHPEYKSKKLRERDNVV